MIEDQDEIGLDEGGGRNRHRITLRQGNRRLEDRHGVIGQGADGPASEARHALRGLHAATRNKGPDGGQRIRPVEGFDRQIGGVGGNAQRPGLNPGDAVADFQQASRADPQEGITS